MYVCVDKRSGLPHNIALESITGLLGVFRDAFIFKTESGPTSSGGAKYLHKDEKFVLTGSESMVRRKALQNLYCDVMNKGSQEAEGITRQMYYPP